MELFWYFIGGFFILNSIPHLVTGVIGQTHMTPFSKKSSPITNVLWGFFNLIAGSYILGLATGTGGIVMLWNANLTGANLWSFICGAISVSLMCAWLFGYHTKLPWQK